MINSIQLLSLPKQQRENLPNFLIIGGMKCGTTSLHYYLNCHPEISMSRDKELDFFVKKRNWKKGIEWYQSQFSGNAKIYGEASPNYTNYPYGQETPKLIYETIPDVKLIYLVRDPIKRIISHYVHKYTDGKEGLDIQEALADFNSNPYNPYIRRSRYYLQLKQYLRYFLASNILILTAEELSRSPQKTLKIVFQFLEVSDSTHLINYQKTLHKSIYKRRKNKVGNVIAKLPIMSQISRLPSSLKNPIDKLIYFPFSSPIKNPILESSLQQELISYFKDDVNQLRRYTGRDFQEWCV